MGTSVVISDEAVSLAAGASCPTGISLKLGSRRSDGRGASPEQQPQELRPREATENEATARSLTNFIILELEMRLKPDHTQRGLTSD
jgi:hypothetical protein